MTFDRNAYMRDYMARQRAKKPASRVNRMDTALREILTKLEGNEKPMAVEIRRIATEAL
jgi:hypothetical protein